MKSTASGTTVFHYDSQGLLIAESDGQGAVWREYVYLGAMPMAVIEDDVLYFVHTDHLDTPRVVTDAAGVVVWRWVSDPFGEAAAEGDPDGDGQEFVLNLRFPGQYFDVETGKHYNYFRDYDPGLGRYLQSDPIGLDGGLNTYAYVERGNPLLETDPFGLWVKKCSRHLSFLGSGEAWKHNPIRHEFLNVSGNFIGFGPSGNFAWSPGILETEEVDEGRCHTMICDDNNFDKYVYEAVRSVGLPTYCPIAWNGSYWARKGARNCQSWVSDVLAIAIKNYLAEESCPRCFQTGSGPIGWGPGYGS